MPSIVYLVESIWSYDRTNTDVVSLTYEDPRDEIEKVLFNAGHLRRQEFLATIRRIFDYQVPQHGSYALTAVWRVVGKTLSVERNGGRGVIPELPLVLVCTFDEKGEPVPPSTS